jgi:hypothetical protein
MRNNPNSLDALEPGQLSAATREPLPRRELSRGVWALLIGLRVYVLVAIPLVGYAFVRALMAGP